MTNNNVNVDAPIQNPMYTDNNFQDYSEPGDTE